MVSKVSKSQETWSLLQPRSLRGEDCQSNMQKNGLQPSISLCYERILQSLYLQRATTLIYSKSQRQFYLFCLHKESSVLAKLSFDIYFTFTFTLLSQFKYCKIAVLAFALQGRQQLTKSLFCISLCLSLTGVVYCRTRRRCLYVKQNNKTNAVTLSRLTQLLATDKAIIISTHNIN